MKITMKAARVNAGLTQVQIAKLLEVSPVTIFNWEQGKTVPKRMQFEQFCKICGMPQEYIFFPKR